MDLVTEASLQALMHKATDVRNRTIDQSSVDAFCAIIKKMPDYAFVASKIIASRIQSPEEWEAIQALSVLDSCMKKCGTCFHNEVGKFRFLNEMIKLVSPKYLGPKTSPNVRDIAIKLLQSWSITHKKEPKIKEAYDMLKKQGVVTEIVKPTADVKPQNIDSPSKSTFDNTSKNTLASTSKSNMAVDHDFGNKLKKLITSKNPDDLEAANRMIKSRVLETERRSTELEKIRTNIKLLSEMINTCQPGAIPPEDLQLMEEVHTECEKLRPIVFRLAGETQEGDILSDVLNLSEELTSVLDKYTRVVTKGVTPKVPISKLPSSLLDLSTPTEPEDPTIAYKFKMAVDDLLGESNSMLDLNNTVTPMISTPLKVSADLDELGVIFGTISTNNSNSALSISRPTNTIEKTNKQKAMQELDVLGESLLQQCKNDLLQPKSSLDIETSDDILMDLTEPKSIDEVMLELNDNVCINSNETIDGSEKPVGDTLETKPEAEIQVKPLTDVSVEIHKITPSDIQPLRVLESVNGVSILIHLARDTPREDVSVYVVTTTSTSNLPLSDYLFQVVVPKKCKFRLQPPSATILPAHNPFLPPSAITQIMLIANPHKLKLHLTFMLSFTMEDETVTEVGEINELPTLKK